MKKRILIYRFGHLGDTIIALPAMWAIRRAFPEAEITLLSWEDPNTNRVATQAVLPGRVLIDRCLGYGGGIRDIVRLWWTLRRDPFDLLVYLAPRLRTSWQVKRDMLFFRSTGIRSMVAHTGFEKLAPRKTGQPLQVETHEADHLLMRLRATGIQVLPPGQGEMDLALTQGEKLQAMQWLYDHLPQDGSAKMLVGICPGSKAPSKIWPEERFEELGRRLIKDFNLTPVVFGSGAERDLAERLISKWGLGLNSAGALSVRISAAVLAQCQLYVGNDTGAMHLAAAVGTPCVVVMSAQDWPGRWSPYGQGHVVLRRSVPCAGCLLTVCHEHGLRCLKEIGVDEVVRACGSVISENGPCRRFIPDIPIRCEI